MVFIETLEEEWENIDLRKQNYPDKVIHHATLKNLSDTNQHNLDTATSSNSSAYYT